MVVVVEALDCGVLDGAVHPFDLAIGPGVLDLGQSMFDAVLPAPHVEHVRDKGCGRSVGIAWWEGELDAIIGEDGVDLVGNRLDERDEEGRCGNPVGLFLQPDKSEFARPINGYEEMELAFGGLYLGDVDMEVADRELLNFLFGTTSPVASGRREMSWRCRQRCNDERLRCGMVACNE